MFPQFGSSDQAYGKIIKHGFFITRSFRYLHCPSKFWIKF